MPRCIGLLVGDEEAFARRLIAHLERESDIVLELATIGGTPERLVSRYDVLLDRMSHRIPHYRAYLKAAVLAGARVYNDPLRTSSNDEFLALSIAARLGVPTARAVLLPQKHYAPDIAPERELKNLEYPLRWDRITGYVGLPAVLRSAGRSVLVHDMAELFAAYDANGNVMFLQQHLEGERVRCLCVGGERMIPLGHHEPQRELESHTLEVSRALGYALNAVEMVVVDGRATLVAANQPFPDLRPEVIGEGPLEMVIEALGNLLVRAAHGEELAFDPCSATT
jgi:hypothetical protein